MTPVTTHSDLARDVQALCLAIVAGDDSALGPLADCIGDHVGRDVEPSPCGEYGVPGQAGLWGWSCGDGYGYWLPAAIFGRLAGGVLTARTTYHAPRRGYPTRQAALLAIAAALSSPGG